jgi:O-antigen ligase
MKLPAKSKKQVDLADFYAIRPLQIWNGLKQESAAFWWLCACIFFEYVRPQALYPAIDVLPYGQIALLFACITAIADKNIKWVKNPGNILFVVFFIIVLISSALAFKPSISFGKIDIIVNWVILYFLIITIINSEQKLIGFLLLFFLVNFKMSQFGFRSFVTKGYSSFGVSGAPGWFRDSGDLGIQMIIFTSLAAVFVLALKKYWGRYKTLLFYMLPVTALVTIVATTSRGAQLGMVATGLWFLLKNPRGIKVIVSIVVVGALLYSILPEKMLDEYRSAGEDRTSETRLALWSAGVDIVRDNPIIGVGYYNWQDYCNFANPEGVGYKDYCLVAHNTYVTGAAELGILGVSFYVVLMLFILVLNARTRKNARKNENVLIANLAHGLDGGIVGYAVATIFYTTLFYPMLYVQLALTVALNEISKKPSSKDA